MSTLRNQLQAGDPLRLEPPLVDDARQRMRASILHAAIAQPAPRRRWSATSVLGPMMVAIAIGALVYTLASRAVTPVLAAVRFEVHLAEDRPVPGLIVAQVGDSDRIIYLHPEIVVDNDDVLHASVIQQNVTQYAVSVDFSPTAVRRMTEATKAHIGRPLAIEVDGKVVLAPVVRGAIGESAVITGNYSRIEAERIANGIGGN